MGVALQINSPRFYDAAEQILIGKKTTIKIETHCVQKIYFTPSFHENVRKISHLENRSALLIKLIVADLIAGHAIVTEKREDGKLTVFVTNEVKKELESKKRTLTGKNGKIKEIASIQVVELEFFNQIVKSLLQNPTKNSSKSEIKTSTTTVNKIAPEKKPSQKPQLSLWKTLAQKCSALIFDFTIQKIEAEVIEEESRIVDRLLKKNQESIEEAADLLKAEIKRMLLKEEIVKYQIKTLIKN